MSQEETVKNSSAYRKPYFDVIFEVMNNFELLHKLAMEGNIAVVFADLTNKEFIKTVKELPNFQSSTNIIYSSNIKEIMQMTKNKNFSTFDTALLKSYNDARFPPIHINATGEGLYLRIGLGRDW